MSKKLLLVDDDPDILVIGELSLTRVGGWDVVTATSGQDCLDKAAVEAPDAIVMDVMMPGMDGMEAFQLLRKQVSTSAIPVVMLTAKVQRSDRERLTELGVDGILEKPFDPVQMPADLAAILGW